MGGYVQNRRDLRRTLSVGILVISGIFAVAVTSSVPDPDRPATRRDEPSVGGFDGWLQIVIPVTADDRALVERLDEGGAGTAISRSSVEVKVTTIDTVERVRSTKANERLLDGDPRKDRFIRNVHALFDGRWNATPAQVVYVRNARGDAGEWLSAYGEALEAAGIGRDEFTVIDETGAVHRTRPAAIRKWRTDITAFAGLVLAAGALALAVIGARRSRGKLRGRPRGAGGRRHMSDRHGNVEGRPAGAGGRLSARRDEEPILPVLFLGIAAILVASASLAIDGRSIHRPSRPRIEVPVATGDYGADNFAGATDSAPGTDPDTGAARGLYDRARADWETAPEPQIPHFGSLLAHIAYQHSLPWGRGYEPPRYDERVLRPTADLSAVAHADIGERTVIHFDDRWIGSMIGSDALPVAQLLAQTAGRAPLQLGEFRPDRRRLGRLRGMAVVVAVIAGSGIVLAGVTRLQVR